MNLALVPTWTLVLYMGFIPPVMMPGFVKESRCEEAGLYAIAAFKRCDGVHECRHKCIIGPPRFVPDELVEELR